MPAVDVLICTYERPEHVLDVVGDVRPQLADGDRVLVIDQSRVVGPTARALEGMHDRRIRHVVAPALGLAAARNRALAESHAPLVLFLDDDVRLHAGCIEAHRRGLSAPGVGATVGFVEDHGMVWNSAATQNKVDVCGRVRVNLGGGERVDVESVQGCNMGFKREALTAAGAFDEGFGGTAFLEEADVAARVRAAGWRISFEPQAALTHLAAKAGGVRVADPLATERWRFHNTGRYLARHRGRAGVLRAAPTFFTIAVKRGGQWGRPDVPARLMAAFWRGAGARRLG